MRPLVIDLFCGLGGWTEGLLAEGYRVVGFDIEQHVYGEHRYPAQLVIQDVLTIHGAQIKDAALIVASPPCQAYSYRAMPWKRAKALPPPDNSLFEACFRIQREAIEATRRTCRECRGEAITRGCCRCESCDGRGWTERHIPLVVENVCGAQKWVGRARWRFGSFYLWGDVPALMPMTKFKTKGPKPGTGNQLCAVRLDQIEDAGIKNPGQRLDPSRAEKFNRTGVDGVKHHASGAAWFDGQADKMLGHFGPAKYASKSTARKAASAQIAKIPLVLARHIGRAWYPSQCADEATA